MDLKEVCWGGGGDTDWIDPAQGQVADFCKRGNEPSGSIKCREFLDKLRTCQLFRKDSAPWNDCQPLSEIEYSIGIEYDSKDVRNVGNSAFCSISHKPEHQE
jgi:hypothetical protein